MARVGESENERSLRGKALRVGGGILPRVEAEYSRGAGDFTPASVHATALTLLPLTAAFAREFFTHARTACRLESSGCIRSPSVAVSLHSLPLDSLDCLKKSLTSISGVNRRRRDLLEISSLSQVILSIGSSPPSAAGGRRASFRCPLLLRRH